jgi:hypothetical protein
VTVSASPEPHCHTGGNATHLSPLKTLKGAHDGVAAAPTEPHPKTSFAIVSVCAQPIAQLVLLHGGSVVIEPVAQ